MDAVMTHFACAESDGASRRAPARALRAGLRRARARTASPIRRRHAANTAASIAHPSAHLDLVRPGIALFGVAPGVSNSVASRSGSSP